MKLVLQKHLKNIKLNLEQELNKNLQSFSGRTHFYNCALSDSNEEAEINITTSHGANSIEPQTAFHQECNPHVREVGKEKIQLVRLDDIADLRVDHGDVGVVVRALTVQLLFGRVL